MAVAAAVQAVLAALVTLGWVHLNDTTLAAIATVAAAVVSVVITIVTRTQVTPVSDPHAVDDSLLVPASPAAAEVLAPERERPGEGT